MKNSKKQNKDRIDIWMVACLTYEEEGEERKRVFPIVIENKIYSGLGADQTKRYFDAMIQYISTVKTETGLDYQPIGVLLSPQGIAPDCGQFTTMTYQQLLDHVLSPISVMAMPTMERSFVETYIRNLSKPSDAANQGYTPLAVSEQERNLITQVYQLDAELFGAMLVAVYGNKVEKVTGKSDMEMDREDLLVLQETWDANDDMLKAVLYQKFTDNISILAKLFKGSNRDNTKYRVYYGKDKTEVFPGKRLSKAMAACAIFKAYLACCPGTTLNQLRVAFPCKDINAYYFDNYYADLFYLYPQKVNKHGEPCLEFTAEKRKGKLSLAMWDFNLNEERLLSLNHGTETAMCVKMWRKSDFDRLLEHVEKQRLTDFITIEECL